MDDQSQERGRMSATTFAALVFFCTTTVTLGALQWMGEDESTPVEPPAQNDHLALHLPRNVETDLVLDPRERRNAEIFQRVAPSVVHVDAIGLVLNMQRADQPPPDGVGSGFVWSDHGHVVTSLHVVNYRSGATTVTLADGTKWPTKFIGMDEEHDLAVLAVSAPAHLLHPIEVGSSADLVIGQDVLAIGNPFGLDHTLTAGVISGLARSISGDSTSVIDGTIQHDAALYPGSSGGPLIDSSGHLVGINTAVRTGSSRLGFAIPVDVINEVVPEIIANGMECWPELGFILAPDEFALNLLRASGWMEETGCDFGVIIIEVQEDGPAAEAGILPVQTGVNLVAIGHVIVGVDGQSLRSRDELTRHLASLTPGDEVRLDLRRRDKAEEVVLVFQSR